MRRKSNTQEPGVFPHGPESLEPYRPETDGPWTYAEAAHLARRAGFGAPPSLAARLLEDGPVEGAKRLLAPAAPDPGAKVLAQTARSLGNLESVRTWWVYRMLHGAAALEKLALFWHDHFATSNRKVGDARLMMRQVELFHRAGAGPFAELLLEVARDPAMLVWLDGNLNRKGRPNENFARELMELFSLGIGNYTEQDIKEAARALTGWHVRRGEFRFVPSAHDPGPKTVFGRTGAFRGEDVVRLCASHPACAPFVAGKLFRFYVHPEPNDRLTQALGRLYEETGKRTGDFLVRLWSSRAFFSREARRALVAGPADYAIGAVRTLEGTAGPAPLARAMESMGLGLLEPPSVKGWDDGLAWLTSVTLLARYRFAYELAEGEALGARLPWEVLEAEGPGGLRRRFFPEGLPAAVVRRLETEAGASLRRYLTGLLALPEAQYV